MDREQQVVELEKDIHAGANKNGMGWLSRRIAEYLYDIGWRKIAATHTKHSLCGQCKTSDKECGCCKMHTGG